MFVYGVCRGPSEKYLTRCRPSLDRCGLGPVIERSNQPSIFAAYGSLIAEALALGPQVEGLVLLHDDVEIRDPKIESTLRRLLGDPGIGLVGVVGGRGAKELSWWKAERLFGHVEHATHTDDFSRGEEGVDLVDGLLMVLSRAAMAAVSLRQGGYPAWHGYDSELCCLVRAAGLSVVVADIEVFHDCKPGPWGRPEYGQAMMEWNLRWRPGTPLERLSWRAKRQVLAGLARWPGRPRWLGSGGA